MELDMRIRKFRDMSLELIRNGFRLMTYQVAGNATRMAKFVSDEDVHYLIDDGETVKFLSADDKDDIDTIMSFETVAQEFEHYEMGGRTVFAFNQ